MACLIYRKDLVRLVDGLGEGGSSEDLGAFLVRLVDRLGEGVEVLEERHDRERTGVLVVAIGVAVWTAASPMTGSAFKKPKNVLFAVLSAISSNCNKVRRE